MKLFLTPDKTWWTGLRWSASLKTFIQCPIQVGEPQFCLATPTEKQAHEKYGALHGIPTGGNMNFAETHALIWGTERDLGLVRETKNVPPGTMPHPSLTLAISRVICEESGIVVKRMEERASESIPAGIEAEGNSDSPSGSGLGSTPTTAGSASPENTERP